MAQQQTITTGFLRDLLRNAAGNVLAITAAATIPMMGVIGGAVDISRVYLVKSRVQAACDSAVLAGRKAMTTLTYTSAAQTRATSMFNVNFQNADYGTTSTSFSSSANSSGLVSGTATTTVPMVLMSIFGQSAKTVSVTCSADVQVPNIDVVFVLDVTGSMNECADGSCSSGEDKKIDSLKKAAKDFYTTLQTALAGNTTSQVRYGFVPYDEAVNGLDVFKTNPDESKGELSLSNFADTMTVQSREANFNTPVTDWVEDSSARTTYDQTFNKDTSATFYPTTAQSPTGTSISNNDCGWYSDNTSFQLSSGAYYAFQPLTSASSEGSGYSTVYQKDGTGSILSSAPSDASTYYYRFTFSRVSSTWSDGSLKSCTRRVTRSKFIKGTTGYKFTDWNFKPITYDVSSYKTGATLTYLSSIDTNAVVPTQGTYNLVQMATMGVGTTSTTKWNGCIEERETTAVATFSPIPTAAYDLNFIDGGSAGNASLYRWRPTIAALTYDRAQPANRMNVTDAVANSNNYDQPSQGCPTARMKSLNVMTQTAFNNYIDTLSPGGNTYLDVGMVWGLRLIAAQGMFASRNLTGPNGGQISRHIIFLTDGEPVSNDSKYTAYGVERMAKRITGSTGVAQAELHARRFQALCDAHRGAVSIWAVGLGSGVTPNLSSCADPGRSYQANNTTQLRDAFRSIAQEVADLRLVS